MIVPNDPRKPTMGCLDHKEREIVLFENGTLGYLDHNDNSDLRGDSNYVPIINKLSDLEFAPNLESSRTDFLLVKNRYIQFSVSIYGLILILIITPLILQRGTWNNMISVWTSIDFNIYHNIVLGFIPCLISLLPEIVLGNTLRKRESKAVLRLNLNGIITEITCTKDFTKLYSQVLWKKKIIIFLLLNFMLVKVIFMSLVFIDFSLAITSMLITPTVVFLLWQISIIVDSKKISNHEIEIPEVELSVIFDYVVTRWGSSQLENIISPGESITKEFKSSLWYDYDKAILSDDIKKQHRFEKNYNPADKKAKNERAQSVIKTVVGFLNANKSNSPGTLLIGVSDEGEIIGLSKDFGLLNVQSYKFRDEFEMQLDSLLRKNIVTLASTTGLWDIQWLEDCGELVCLVKVKISPKAVYHKCDGKEIYYRRTPSKTEPLSGIELEKELGKFKNPSRN